jgi:hypothetical protein
MNTIHQVRSRLSGGFPRILVSARRPRPHGYPRGHRYPDRSQRPVLERHRFPSRLREAMISDVFPGRGSRTSTWTEGSKPSSSSGSPESQR